MHFLKRKKKVNWVERNTHKKVLVSLQGMSLPLGSCFKLQVSDLQLKMSGIGLPLSSVFTAGTSAASFAMALKNAQPATELSPLLLEFVHPGRKGLVGSLTLLLFLSIPTPPSCFFNSCLAEDPSFFFLTAVSGQRNSLLTQKEKSFPWPFSIPEERHNSLVTWLVEDSDCRKSFRRFEVSRCQRASRNLPPPTHTHKSRFFLHPVDDCESWACLPKTAGLSQERENRMPGWTKTEKGRHPRPKTWGAFARNAEDPKV